MGTTKGIHVSHCHSRSLWWLLYTKKHKNICFLPVNVTFQDLNHYWTNITCCHGNNNTLFSPFSIRRFELLSASTNLPSSNQHRFGRETWLIIIVTRQILRFIFPAPKTKTTSCNPNNLHNIFTASMILQGYVKLSQHYHCKSRIV